jgi:type IV pilus assembly protein PilA
MIRVFLTAVALLALAGCAERVNEKAIQARETAAIQTLRTILTAQIQYRLQYNRYAKTLRELGPPGAGASVGQGAADLLPRELSEGSRNGYRFAVELTPGGFAVTATAETFGVTGQRSFYADETMVVRARKGPGAAATDPEIR